MSSLGRSQSECWNAGAKTSSSIISDFQKFYLIDMLGLFEQRIGGNI